ncbi:MAG: hypothetical protein IH608_12380 [Proteobacteria bacterium]|nr:hypothetical protein [Pseudomonadota bacterium]
MMLYSAYFAGTILRRWDLRSGSEGQLTLERRTYLVTTILAYLFGFQLLSPFLYVFTADRLCPLFTGAMCAAGTLNANALGYPTLVLKLVNFFLAGLWLVLNYADNRAHDYPLIRRKCLLLLAMAPLVVAEAVSQAGFFLGLRADLITSCCGTLFSEEGRGLASDLAAAPLGPSRVAFFATLGATVAAGVYSLRRGAGRYLFAGLSAGSFFVGLVAVLSFLSIYFYELPTHHCPFCLLQAEYGFVGYPLYLALLGGGVGGAGVGVIEPFRGVPSLRAVVPAVQTRLTAFASLCFSVVLALAAWGMLATDFTP